MRNLIVVGSGIAGLFTTLSAHRRGVRDVLIVTKGALEESTTRYAQGGIAAAVGDGDSWELHEADTLGAGAKLCDPEAVRGLHAGGDAAGKHIELALAPAVRRLGIEGLDRTFGFGVLVAVCNSLAGVQAVS